MNQEERLDYLLDYLLSEDKAYASIGIPEEMEEKRRLLRSLMNVRMPLPVSKEFLDVQDAYLKERLQERGITRLSALNPIQPGIYLWQGDIATLAADGIVNAANSQMLGCFVPCHGCIDNAIHTYAGIQLRLACHKIMQQKGRTEETGRAEITKAYNLPCQYVLHTVGPYIAGAVTKKDCEMLASCYWSCLEKAKDYGLHSIAFCCISTGEYHFPNELAAQIAIETVEQWQKANPFRMEVIFNVFKDTDKEIYQRLLQQ